MISSVVSISPLLLFFPPSIPYAKPPFVSIAFLLPLFTPILSRLIPFQSPLASSPFLLIHPPTCTYLLVISPLSLLLPPTHCIMGYWWMPPSHLPLLTMLHSLSFCLSLHVPINLVTRTSTITYTVQVDPMLSFLPTLFFFFLFLSSNFTRFLTHYRYLLYFFHLQMRSPSLPSSRLSLPRAFLSLTLF